MDDNNPLLKALPPATDYLSYLTILEYNLTTDHLPTLHTVLQDPDLTANIGWDLVHLLLPLLPASYQCLQDVARLGNPREVVLKVAELLEALAHVEDDSDRDHDQDHDQDHDSDRDSHGSAADAPRFPRAQDDHHGTTEQRDMPNPTHRKLPKPTSSSLVQFTTLIEMLSIVHPRIQTKYPSRFLSTSLQAILPAYLQVAASLAATDAVLALIKELAGPSRPKLPPRKSSTAIVVLENAPVAPDPEGRDEVLAPEELALQNRLLQSFLSYIIEDFVSSMPSLKDPPGLAWSCRLEEKLRPQKMVPGRESYSKRFTDHEGFHERDTIIGQMVVSLFLLSTNHLMIRLSREIFESVRQNCCPR